MLGIICCIYMQLNSCHQSQFICTCVPVGYLLPMTITDAELNGQFPLAIDQKLLPDLLKLRAKAEDRDIQFFVLLKRSRGTVWP